ncbi:MAG: LysM peptidoglycan-binding domain-containing protein [Caldilineaceae bacterium]|nr:LysM peptidoglycan-binding domain-containing protein [Caldilineaceae bacterium]
MDETAPCRSRRLHPLHGCLTGLLTVFLLLIPQTLHAQDGGLSEAAQAVAAAVNQARVDAGLGPLAVDPLLNQAAQGHVVDMANNYVYGHYGSDGSTVEMRVARTGYAQNPWVSENWVSSTSVAGAMTWWMNDYVHRVNILNGNWQEIGVGVGARNGEMIFVTVFSGNSGDAPAAEAPAEPQAEVAAAAPAEAAPPPVAAAPPPAQPLTIPAEGMDYTIRPGDTLLSVALAYGAAWENLAAANGLSENALLQIGQVIRLPGANAPVAGAPAAAEAAGAAPAAEPVPPVESEPYTVQAGDTLFTIAGRRGVTWQEVASLNGFGEQVLLQIGQEIQVPKKKAVSANIPTSFTSTPAAAAQPAAQPAAAPAALHTVADGETIVSIALQHGLDWQQLLALNGLTENSLLQPGQTLRLQ